MSIDLRPGSSLRPDFLFLDIEASSLVGKMVVGGNVFSHPIEIGWSDDALNSSSFLIRPHETWTEYAWSRQSEEIHGISRETLFSEGVPVAEACDRFVAACLGKRLVMSDAPAWDNAWLQVLFHAAGRSLPFKLVDETDAVAHQLPRIGKTHDEIIRRYGEASTVAERLWPHPHRAADDAVRMAARFRLAVDEDFYDEAKSMLPLAP